MKISERKKPLAFSTHLDFGIGRAVVRIPRDALVIYDIDDHCHTDEIVLLCDTHQIYGCKAKVSCPECEKGGA